ncbi:MAG: DUF1501 domain-containing protein [Planctomycetaceae bacterium]|nr:DUF1501 domain-containing protein [Planctomycetales bacterium]MCB9925660.1 DUF1501 domain-containing protein [Planctomycetaceae bacterium]
MSQVSALRAASGAEESGHPGKSVIYIFLSGGLSQHDSFDMKPDAPDEVRGEFKPIATATPGLQICEHLPRLAQRSDRWSLCRSMTHHSNEHSQGHHIMLTGRTEMPRGFSPSRPQDSDWPSIAAIANATTRPRSDLPAAAVLPERLVHYSGRVIPGQFAGMMGENRNPWFIEAAPYHTTSYGAFPEFQFDHQERGNEDKRVFKAPNLELPHGLTNPRFQNRMALLHQLSTQRKSLERSAETQNFDRHRQGAISLLTDQRVHHALDVTNADEKTQERYGKNAFGWSLLMARRLVEAGVNMVQVNLGNDEAWDTHGNAFPHLKEKLFPPTDQAVSALVDDLDECGILADTLIVMAGEFGRTPKITLLPNHYKLPGRDHWGALQSVWLAGGGVEGGRVIGSSDKLGAYPEDSPQRPENLAATIYNALGIPATAAWYDQFDRPHHIYHAEPIRGLA